MTVISRVFLCVAMIVFSSLSYAETTGAIKPAPLSVTIIAKSNNAELPKLIETLITENPATRPKVRYIDYARVKSKEHLCQLCLNANLILTVGYEATKATLELHPKRPIVSILVRKASYDQLLEDYRRTADADHQPVTTAIFMDQPVRRYLDLIREIVPEGRRVGTIGTLLGPQSIAEREELEAEAFRRGMHLKIVEVKPNDDPVDAMQYLLPDSQMFLALPDPHVYNRYTAKGLLMTALRSKVPVVAYSKSYVNMGALSGLHSDTRQIAQQTAGMILRIIENPKEALPPPEYAAGFKIAVNTQVKRTFGFPNKNEVSLKYALDDLETND